MKKIILAAALCCGLFSSAQIFEETTSGLVITIPNEDIIGLGVTFTARPMWELGDDLYLGGNLSASLYFINDEFGGSETVDSPTYIGLGPGIRYYLLEYFYGGVDTAYNFEINGQAGNGIRFFPHVGYSFETINLEAGYHLFDAENVDLGGLAFGIYYKF